MRNFGAVVLAVVIGAGCGGKKEDGEKKGTGTAAAPPAKLGELAADPGAGDGKVKWAVGVGGLQSDVARDLVLHPTGGVVLCGDFEEKATFGALGEKTSNGASDAFVMASRSGKATNSDGQQRNNL